MTTTTNVQQVKVNKVTQAQYDSMTKNENEFYVIVDREYLDEITSSMVTNALGYIPAKTSVQTRQSIYEVTDVSGDITVNLLDTDSLVSLSPSGTVSLTFDYSPSPATYHAYTFELMINMTTPSSITFNSVTWMDGDAPDLSETGLYFLVFRTLDGGSNWYGNLQGKW